VSICMLLYLLIRPQIEDEYKKGDCQAAYREYKEMLQDPYLPFYYRGHFHLLLSQDNEDPVSNCCLIATRHTDAD
jgi:hypothetical protein